MGTLSAIVFVFVIPQLDSGEEVFTKARLASHAAGGEKPLYLAILGEVFDVTAGEQHYGQGMAYAHFCGRDSSRAFVTGQFDEEGLTDDLEGLSPQQVKSVVEWRDFYRKTYKPVGKVEGAFYDRSGRPREALSLVEKLLATAEAERAEQEADEQRRPLCNSKWSQDEGSEVWCNEGLFPRKAFKLHGQGSLRCACIRAEELDDPNLQSYDGCAADQSRCVIPAS
eukprot:jgi/Mesvir1/21747/Mv04154-RA.1